MAQGPNNPFSNQYQNSAPRNSGGNTVLWVLGILGTIFLLVGLLCCGGGYFLFNQAKVAINEEAAKEVQREFGSDPVFKENIGELESAEMSFGAIALEAQKAQENGENQVPVMVFNVKGSKGEGRIVFKENPDDGTAMAVLEMSDGTEYELEIDDDTMDRMDSQMDPNDTVIVDDRSPQTQSGEGSNDAPGEGDDSASDDTAAAGSDLENESAETSQDSSIDE